MNQTIEPNASNAPSVDSESRDGGYSFVETVVAMVLTGVVVLAILTAVQTSVRASSISYESAQVETVLLNAADQVQRVTRAVCSYDGYVKAAAPAGWDPALISSSTELLRRDIPLTGDPANDWVACTDAPNADDVVRVTITATSPGRGITRTMVVVQSDVG